jgi:hypothetical protein
MLELLFYAPQLFDTHVITPMSALLQKLILEMDLVDLVLWFPNLSWQEFTTSLAAILGCRLITDQIEAIAMNRLRGWLADSLIRLAGVVRPATDRVGHEAAASEQLAPRQSYQAEAASRASMASSASFALVPSGPPA